MFLAQSAGLPMPRNAGDWVALVWGMLWAAGTMHSYARPARGIAVFFKAWNYVCHASQVAEAGAYVTVQILDQNIGVLRGADGVLRAFCNLCSHRAQEVLQGCGQAKMITCPDHA